MAMLNKQMVIKDNWIVTKTQADEVFVGTYANWSIGKASINVSSSKIP